MTKIEVQKTATLHGHKDCVYTLAKSPHPAYFFSSGGDGVVARWYLENPEIGEVLVKVPNSVYALCGVPEKGHLIVGQNHEGLHLVDLEKKREIRSVKLTASPIFDIQYWQDMIFVACGDGVVIVVDYDSFVVKKHLKASDKSARCISINPIEREFAVGYSDNFIRVFSLQTLGLNYTINAHKLSVFTVAYSPDGRFLLSGSRDAHLRVWDVENKYQMQESIVAHMYAINHITYSPDEKYFATGSMDKSIKLWDAEAFKLLKVIDKARHAGHGTSVNKLLWTNFQSQLVSGSDDRTLSVWDLKFI